MPIPAVIAGDELLAHHQPHVVEPTVDSLNKRAIARSLLSLVVMATSAGAQQQRSYQVAGPFLEPEYECAGTIGGLAELSDARSLVSCVRSNDVHLIDWSGKTSRQIGQVGRGPGEYRLVERLAAMNGDSALLYDASSRKLLLATPRGVRDWMLPAGDRQKWGLFVGADERGRTLQVLGFRFRSLTGALSQNGGLYAAESMLVTVRHPDGRALDTIARVRGPYRRVHPFTMSLGEGRGMVPAEVGNPVVGGDQVTMFPDGWVAIAYREPYRVDWIRPDGAAIKGVPLDRERVRLDADLKKLLLQIQHGDAVPGLTPSAFDDWPVFLPPFARVAGFHMSHPLVQDSEGRLLITRTPRSLGAGNTYDIINRRGEREGTLTAPPGMSVLYIGRQGLYAVVVDTDDVRHLRRYARPFP